jgi:PPOX class probable F420-dependent enzyme
VSILDARHVAVLATLEPDGTPYLSAVWFLWDGEHVYVSTGGNTRKARNAAARPRGSIIVDSRRDDTLGGAAASGPLVVVRGADARELNERVWAKYLTPQGLADERVGGAIRAHDDVTILLTPERWRTWNTTADFGGAYEEPGQTLPLDA